MLCLRVSVVKVLLRTAGVLYYVVSIIVGRSCEALVFRRSTSTSINMAEDFHRASVGIVLLNMLPFTDAGTEVHACTCGRVGV